MLLSSLRVFRLLKRTFKRFDVRHLNSKPPWNVLFFGSDQFSLYSLEALNMEYRKGHLVRKLEVVTTVKGKPNPVRVFATKENLCIHRWPADADCEGFDVGLVVSFGHLIPEGVIEKFRFGMLNVHASLLPRWRGAAPIIYAIANGDTKTGISIMRIRPKRFDVGEILMQDSVDIDRDTRLPELHEKLGLLGARHLVNVLSDLPGCLAKATPQGTAGVTLAPRLDSDFPCIKWATMSSGRIYDLDRAVDGMMHLTAQWRDLQVKLIGIEECPEEAAERHQSLRPGFVECDKRRNILRVLCSDSRFIIVRSVGVFGKKVMGAKDFYSGYISKVPVELRYFK